MGEQSDLFDVQDVDLRFKRRFTHRRQAVLDYVVDRIVDGDQPTLQEVAEEFGVTKQAAHKYMRALSDLGYIRRGRGHRQSKLTPLALKWRARAASRALRMVVPSRALPVIHQLHRVMEPMDEASRAQVLRSLRSEEVQMRLL